MSVSVQFLTSLSVIQFQLTFVEPLLVGPTGSRIRDTITIYIHFDWNMIFITHIIKNINLVYTFRPGKSTTEPIFILRIIQEKYREMNKELHMVFLDLEKAYDRVPRELIWWCLRKKGVPEGYVTIIQYMYNDCETLVSTRTGDTEYFHVGVGLHQGSALSPLLFILIMDVLQAEIGKEPPWVMLFANDLVICEHSGAEV